MDSVSAFSYESILNQQLAQISGLQLVGQGPGVLRIADATTGDVTADASTDDLQEGKSNLYFLTARSRAALSGGTGVAYNSGTGVMSLANTAVTPGSYTLASVTVDAQGRLTSATNGTAVTSVATGTGLTGGPITTTGTLSLANTAVTPGSYTLTNVTVDAQGRLTSATNGVAVTSSTGTANQVLVNGTSGVAQTGAVTLSLPQSVASTSNVSFRSLSLNMGSTSGTGLTVLSGNSANYLGVGLGRGSVDATIGVPSSAALYSLSANAGDVVMRAENSSNRVILQSGAGTGTLQVSNWSVGVNGPANNAALETLAYGLNTLGRTNTDNTWGEFAVWGGVGDTVKSMLQVNHNVGGFTGTLMGSRTNHPLGFAVWASEVARFDTSGRLGIGTQSPTFPLHLAKQSMCITGTSDVSEILLGGSPSFSNRDYCSKIRSTSNVASNFGSTLGLYTHTTSSNLGEPTERLRLDQYGNAYVLGGVISVPNTTGAATFNLNSNPGSYSIQCAPGPGNYPLRFCSSSDPATQRTFEFGMYTGDSTSNAWNTCAILNPITGIAAFGYNGGSSGGVILTRPATYGTASVQAVTSSWGTADLALNPAGGNTYIGSGNWNYHLGNSVMSNGYPIFWRAANGAVWTAGDGSVLFKAGDNTQYYDIQENASHVFRTSSWTERMRVNSSGATVTGGLSVSGGATVGSLTSSGNVSTSGNFIDSAFNYVGKATWALLYTTSNTNNAVTTSWTKFVNWTNGTNGGYTADVANNRIENGNISSYNGYVRVRFDAFIGDASGTSGWCKVRIFDPFGGTGSVEQKWQSNAPGMNVHVEAIMATYWKALFQVEFQTSSASGNLAVYGAQMSVERIGS